MGDYTAFTYQVPKNHRHSIVIDVEVKISASIRDVPQNQRIPIAAKALIDTGASRSAVSSLFVQTAKLISYGKCSIRQSRGEYISSVYTVDIIFPHGMYAHNIKAAEFFGHHEFDFIVGMDILRMTDIAISNAGGITVLSLRSPPANEHIDFTKK
ncbi:MAG: retroviral-like aspartic protease family protein [Treponema sp.]|nr:retroviral-like aspartic protease family protein [Treponema sp.]